MQHRHGSPGRTSSTRIPLMALAAIAALGWPAGLDAQQEGGVDAPSDTATASDTGERWEDIAPGAVTAGSVATPVRGDMEGPSVLAVQVLLDRAQFSPGVIDGRWGANTEKAVYWYQRDHGLPATGAVDRATLDYMTENAGGDLVTTHTLTPEDVEGPFVALPEDVYERAELSCTCYESLAEKLGERFHVTPATLRQLNPGTDLDTLDAGDRLAVPNVRDPAGAPDGTPVAEIVISEAGHWLHALDADGALLYHFPAVLGSEFAPSPDGEFTVTSITHDPSWHYKPDLLTGVDPSKPDAMVPPGPNNAVGVVWMQLSRPHYGIHGTKAPSTVGYADSHGCVRLTNWDITFLAERMEAGVPVRFVETDRRADDR